MKVGIPSETKRLIFTLFVNGKEEYVTVSDLLGAVKHLDNEVSKWQNKRNFWQGMAITALIAYAYTLKRYYKEKEYKEDLEGLLDSYKDTAEELLALNAEKAEDRRKFFGEE